MAAPEWYRLGTPSQPASQRRRARTWGSSYAHDPPRHRRGRNRWQPESSACPPISMNRCITTWTEPWPHAHHVGKLNEGWHNNYAYLHSLMIQGNNKKDQMDNRRGQPSKILRPAMQTHHANYALRNHDNRRQRNGENDSFVCLPVSKDNCIHRRKGRFPRALRTHSTMCIFHAMRFATPTWSRDP